MLYRGPAIYHRSLPRSGRLARTLSGRSRRVSRSAAYRSRAGAWARGPQCRCHERWPGCEPSGEPRGCRNDFISVSLSVFFDHTRPRARPTGGSLSTKARAAARAAQSAQAQQRALDIAPLITELHAEAVGSANGIARALNERRIPTMCGGGQWSAVQVCRVLGRLHGARTKRSRRSQSGVFAARSYVRATHRRIELRAPPAK